MGSRSPRFPAFGLIPRAEHAARWRLLDAGMAGPGGAMFISQTKFVQLAAGVAVTLAMAGGVLFFRSPLNLQSLPGQDEGIGLRSAAMGVVQHRDSMNPMWEIISGAETVWQIPPDPTAVVFFAHGCTHKAPHFWDPQPNCHRCLGLPEDRALVLEALRRRMAVLSISSQGTCWGSSWPPISADVKAAAEAIKQWRQEHKLEHLPLYALGASSGGYFISVLAHKVPFAALVIIISSGVAQAFKTPLPDRTTYPPSLFVHMPRDDATAERISKAIHVLQEGGGTAAELLCNPLPITPSFFAERIPFIDQVLSERMYQLLSANEYLDKGTGLLLKDGRRSDWVEVFQKAGLLPDVLDAEGSQESKRWIESVAEELNLAFAMHEMTSLHADKMFDWLEGVCRNDKPLEGCQ